MLYVMHPDTHLHSAFGFLGGKEVKEAGVGNLGLLDRACILSPPHAPADPSPIEREAFRWVQKYISAFGGDPAKVMMYVATRLDASC